MGKLGGGELNVSSDIDLVFVYPEEGETDGPAAARQPRILRPPRPPRHRRARRATRRRLRVPRRHAAAPLRRERSAGGVVRRARALPRSRRAATWERYAWLKARALTGARHDELDAIGRAVRVPQIPRLRRLRGLARRAPPDPRAGATRRITRRNIKLGPGGIREIEFIVQALQFVRGGREPALRVRGTLPALAALGARGLLPRRGGGRALPTPTRSCATSSTGCSIATIGRPRRCRRTLTSDALAHALRVRCRCLGAPALDRLRDGMRAVRRLGTSSACSRADAEPDGDRLSARCRSPPSGARGRSRGHGSAGLRRITPSRARSSATLARVRSERRATCSCPRCRGSASTRWCRKLLAVAAARERRRRTRRRSSSACSTLLEAVSRRSAYLALLIEHPPVLPRLAQLMGAIAVGGRLPDAASDPARRAARRARAARASPIGTHGGASSLRMLASACRRRRAADGRACATSSTRRSFRLLAQDLAGRSDGRAARRSSLRAGRRRPRRDAREVLGADARRRRADAAQVRDHRLRQARRQGARLCVRPRSRVPVRRRRRGGARSATRGSRSASSPGSPRRPRAGRSTTPICGCGPTARRPPRLVSLAALPPLPARARRGPGSTRR